MSSDAIVVLDFEATNLLEPEAAPLERQPHIIEIGAARLDWRTLKEKARLTALVKPPILIPPECTKITGITDEMVADAPPFVAFYSQMVDVFLGARWVIAHNLPYDRGVLFWELKRINRELRFPWPPNHLCSVELTRDIYGRDMKLIDLYKEVTGEEDHKQTHRGGEDVDMLIKVVEWLRKEERI